VEVTDRCGAESLLRCAPEAGEVLIADRGYAKARQLQACPDPSGPDTRDFIVRVGWKALALRDLQGEPFDLIAYMQTLAADAGPRECAVQAVVGPTKQPSLLPLRLIVVPLPPDKAAINRKKLKRTASKHQDTLDPRSLIAAGFLVLVTALPADIPAAEIATVYRLRWQGGIGIQASQIVDPYRPIANPHHKRRTELAVSASDPASADRGHLAGFPGIFPLRGLSAMEDTRHGGRSRSPSMPWPLFYAAQHFSPSSQHPRACMDSWQTPKDAEGDSFAPENPYPDTYGARPGLCPGRHRRPHAAALAGW
jgi:hypothetical protein